MAMNIALALWVVAAYSTPAGVACGVASIQMVLAVLFMVKDRTTFNPDPNSNGPKGWVSATARGGAGRRGTQA